MLSDFDIKSFLDIKFINWRVNMLPVFYNYLVGCEREIFDDNV